jgi:regulator of replication initiation timing
LKRICDKIDNLDNKIKVLQDDFKEYKKENKTNIENIGIKIEYINLRYKF